MTDPVTVPVTGSRHPADEVLLGFARAVRAAGVPVTADRAQAFLAAAAHLGLAERECVRRAGHATLCAGPDDLLRLDLVLEAWFDARDGPPRTQPAAPAAPAYSQVPLLDDPGEGGEGEEQADAVRAAASATEVLRHRDVAGLTPAEKARLGRMFAGLPARVPLRRSPRRQGWHRGEVDPARTVRAGMRRLGEPAELVWRRRRLRPRRVVLLIDVSGSMAGYADPLLRLAHRLTQAGPPGSVETFTVGTRLTHLTRAMRLRDPERALVAAGEAVPDWSGGTRLGESLAVFAQRFGRRGMARGAVVVVMSDGWERGDPAVLAGQVAGLARLAHRMVWVNPHRGKAGYEPLQRGIAAVLPFLDDFVAGHSLATYAEVCEVVARA